MRCAPVVCVLAVLAAAPLAFANDRWDQGTLGDDDGPTSNPNEIPHGASQIHDLQSSGAPADQDWVQIRVRNRHSYEARVSGASGIFWINVDGLPCAAGLCASLDRVDAAGNVLQPGAMLEGSSRASSLRWAATATGGAFVRIQGPSGTALSSFDEYEIEFFDTTYALPRFNNSATQTTVLIIQNLKTTTVIGTVDFYNAAGTLLHSEPVSLPAAGTLVLNTAGLPVAGQSGSALIAHNGGWGALAGKAVALEPATGFTFDTPLTTMPR